MVQARSSELVSKLQRGVVTRTGRRVRDLGVEVKRERIVLSGRTTSFYVKQLAQQGVLDVLPRALLENTIVVDPAESAGPQAM